MKKILLVFIFLLIGVFYVTAQDILVLINGNILEAKIIEISTFEIRYKHFDNLEGPIYIIPISNVLSIRFENGTQQIFNKNNSNNENIGITAMDPNKLTIGININPTGLLLYGGSLCVEFGKGNFNSEINLIIPYGLANKTNGGAGILFTFNYLWHSRIGGFYLGGGLGYIWRHDYYHLYNSDGSHRLTWGSHVNTLGLNIGYKFVTNSGMYFRTGIFGGIGIEWAWSTPITSRCFVQTTPFTYYIKPDLTVGYSF